MRHVVVWMERRSDSRMGFLLLLRVLHSDDAQLQRRARRVGEALERAEARMNLKDAFAGIQEAQAPAAPKTQAPKRLGVGGPKHLPLQGTAKSKHPDFEPVKVYVRRVTRKQAWRKWEDAGGGDFSDLVETLLHEYLKS
jgi:hypothetical protein